MKLIFILISLFLHKNAVSVSADKTDICSLESFICTSESTSENIHHYQSIGKWRYMGSDFPRSTFEIKLKKSEYICIVTFLDDKSSTSTEYLTKISTNRFKVNKSRTGEYYKINSKNGQLEMWDQDGLFIIAHKI